MVKIGRPDLFMPGADEIHISVTFTWDISEAKELRREYESIYPGKVKLGGPALGTFAGEFEPGRYLREGYTITSRGCPNKCPFCLVPKREGRLREIDIRNGWNVQDNNLLACSHEHFECVIEMLKLQKCPAEFSGGLEACRITDWHISKLKEIRINQMFLAWDRPQDYRTVLNAIERLRTAGFKQRQIRCFVLSGFGNDTPRKANARCEKLFKLGALPFMMLYQPDDKRINYDGEWKPLRRQWTRPAATFAYMNELGGRNALRY